MKYKDKMKYRAKNYTCNAKKGNTCEASKYKKFTGGKT